MITALQALGHAVRWLDDRQNYFFPTLPRNKFLWKISRRWRWLRQVNAALLNKKILHNATDIVLVNKGIEVMPETLLELRKRGIITANWFPDNARTKEYGPWIARMMPFYDHFFSFHEDLSGAHYLPVAVDPSYFDLSHTDKQYAHHLVFVGAYFPEREAMLSAIRDFKPVIYGSSAWATSSFASSYRGMLTPEQFMSVYAMSDISININTDPPVPGVNLKTFEIPACGGFQISDYRSGLEDLFVIGKEIAVYRDAKELRTMVEYYESHPEERRAIAQAGRARVLKSHTMLQRMKTICDTLFSTSGSTVTPTPATR